MECQNREDNNERILLRDSLLAKIRELREMGKRIVLTNGCFDLVHLGHVKALEMARSLGDVLIVGVNDDMSVRQLKGSSRPIMPQKDRAGIISALRCVDYVTVFSEVTAEKLVATIKPDVYVKGGDYDKTRCKEMDLVEGYGGEVVVLPYVAGRSSTSLIEKISDACYGNWKVITNEGGNNNEGKAPNCGPQGR